MKQIEEVKLSEISVNPDNPRQISKEKFDRLIDSLLIFPKMLEIRPIVVDANLCALGGNMRTEALNKIALMSYKTISDRLSSISDFQKMDDDEQKNLSLFWKEWIKNQVVPVVKAESLSEEEKRQFIIKDNLSYGEWDMDALANSWDVDELKDWGMDLPVWDSEEDQKENNEQDMPDNEGEENNNVLLFPEDRVFSSNNDFEIPTLRIDRQPTNGLLLPFAGWGSDTRAKKGIQTYHFYVEDYRFEAIWKKPMQILETGCMELVEPNLSLFDTTPIAYGLHQIYKKRWIARYWQECGAKVYADLNVSRKFYKYNCLGIPNGYNAFMTRGYADREEYLKMEIQIAREISGMDAPNMIVYGGGERIKELCAQNNVLYVEQFMSNKKGGKNG